MRQKSGHRTGQRFTPGEQLRCEGPGTLKSAKDPASDRPLLVRSLPLSANGASAARALEELPRHVSLPRIAETREVGDSVEIVIEEPVGTPLTELVEQPLPPQALLVMGAELASALSMLHQHGLAHGELSPEAVRIEPNGRAVLWSFPLLLANRLADRRLRERDLPPLWSTAPFFSPERAQGSPFAPAADVFALGVLLCRAGGGTGPKTLSTLETLNAVATGKWRPQLPPGQPKHVRKVLARMIHPDPLERPHASVVAHCLCLAQKEPNPSRPWLGRLAALTPWELPARARAQAAVLAALVVAAIAAAQWWGPKMAGAFEQSRALPAEVATAAFGAAAALGISPGPIEWCTAADAPAVQAQPTKAAAKAFTKAQRKESRKAKQRHAKKQPREGGGVLQFFASLFGGK